ncbi:hypothetical protein [Microcoleus sp. FACHB-SPT15]|jgi:hypothetical protein|nr:hypothetical protein [Microcoleus sp. FACHB-SPT15]
MNSTKDMTSTKAQLRTEVRKLAEEAFHLKLISGYGDGQYSDEYQIVYNGKPKHFPLERARLFLRNLMATRRENHWH